MPDARTSTKIGPGRWPASWVQNPALASTRRPKSSTLPVESGVLGVTPLMMAPYLRAVPEPGE